MLSHEAASRRPAGIRGRGGCPDPRPLGPFLVLLFGALVALGLPGCAGTRVWEYAGEPGVPVTVELKYGGTLDGQLVGYEDGGLLVDHAIPKSEELEVVRKDGVDIVYVRGVAVGKAVEVRDFDVVVREKLFRSEYEDARVKSRAYLGWGTAIAAVLAFFLVKLLEEV